MSPYGSDSSPLASLERLDELSIQDNALYQWRPQYGEFPAIEMVYPWMSIPPSLDLAKETTATAFFIKNFAMSQFQQDSLRGYIELLLPMYQNSRGDSVLQKATHAVALGALGARHNISSFRVDANRIYGKALREVGAQIRDPATAKSDELLMSILLFSLFEAGFTPESAYNFH